MLDQAAHDKLEQLQALLRHQVPIGDLGRVIERALDALLEQTMERRFAQTTTVPPRVKTTLFIPPSWSPHTRFMSAWQLG